MSDSWNASEGMVLLKDTLMAALTGSYKHLSDNHRGLNGARLMLQCQRGFCAVFAAFRVHAKGGRTLRKDVFLPSKRLLSAFYTTLPSKHPSKNLVFTENPYRRLLNRHSPPKKERIFPGVHKIDAPISGPRIADKYFTDTRIFLKCYSASGLFVLFFFLLCTSC